MRNKWMLGLVVAAACVACTDARSVRADDAGWEVLGRREVDFAGERDVIPVTRADGRFDKIRFHVAGNGVEIGTIKVHFANGGVEDVEVREHIAAGGNTRVIDLPGEARTIEKVVLVYRTRGARRGKAMVTLWGHDVRGAPAPRQLPTRRAATTTKAGSSSAAAM